MDYPKKLRRLCGLLFLLCPLWTSAQCPGALSAPFKRAEPGPAVAGLSQPWAGGLNACHFAPLGSGYIAFDRIGSRIRYYDAAWRQITGAEHSLPPLHSWVQTKDFTGNGLEDIFTFNGVAGIAVYKNLGNAYQLYTSALPAEMLGQTLPLYCISEDYPVIEDLDGDGDLDVLNFWVPSSGDFLLYYRNYAVEELNRPDTFLLRLEDWSWGCFTESEESNQIYLDSCSPQTSHKQPLSSVSKTSASKHSGSTVFAFKNPETDLFDLVLGDVGYPGLYYLQNGGTPEKARIVKYDTFFPAVNPVQLYTFPIMSTVRVGDTLCYVFSPYAVNGFQTQGSQSLWRYRAVGNHPFYAEFIEKDFLQNTMIDVGAGAYPVAFDADGDGLTDLVIGNYAGVDGVASLTLYKNTGTAASPAFTFVTDDYLEQKQYGHAGLVAAFFEDTVCFGNESSYPVRFDLNGDGVSDLITGGKRGRLSYYENTSEGFVFTTDTLGGVDVTDRNYTNFGYAKPSFYRYEDGRILLAVGNENGEVYLYSVPQDINEHFEFLGKAATEDGVIKAGSHAAPLLFDWNGDGSPELMVGNQCGGLEYFEGGAWEPAPVAAVEVSSATGSESALQVSPNPFRSTLGVYAPYVGPYTLHDLRGRIVAKGYLQAGQNALSLSYLPAGFYLLHFDNGKSAAKVVKMQ